MLTTVGELETFTVVALSVPLAVRDTAPPATAIMARGSLVTGIIVRLVIDWGTRTV